MENLKKKKKKSEREKLISVVCVGLCRFLQNVRCVTPRCPDGLKPSALARQMNPKQAVTFLLQSAFRDRIALVNLMRREIFGLGSVSSLLTQKAKALFRRPPHVRGEGQILSNSGCQKTSRL